MYITHIYLNNIYIYIFYYFIQKHPSNPHSLGIKKFSKSRNFIFIFKFYSCENRNIIKVAKLATKKMNYFVDPIFHSCINKITNTKQTGVNEMKITIELELDTTNEATAIFAIKQAIHNQDVMAINYLTRHVKVIRKVKNRKDI